MALIRHKMVQKGAALLYLVAAVAVVVCLAAAAEGTPFRTIQWGNGTREEITMQELLDLRSRGLGFFDVTEHLDFGTRKAEWEPTIPPSATDLSRDSSSESDRICVWELSCDGAK